VIDRGCTAKCFVGCVRFPGIQLLQKMGWRQGKGIGTGQARAAAEGGGKWGGVAGVGIENTALYRIAPKNDVFGLGFDPFKVAGHDCFGAVTEWASHAG
jgi:hypothetical protein